MNSILNIFLFILAELALVEFIFLIVLISRYFHLRSYDKQYGTEYRFKEGNPWILPIWLENFLRMIEKRGWL